MGAQRPTRLFVCHMSFTYHSQSATTLSSSTTRPYSATMTWNIRTTVGTLFAVAATVGVAVAVFTAKPATTLDPAKPEGVVQAYVKAALKRDFITAATYIGSDSQCAVESFDYTWIPENAQVALSDVSVVGDAATVTVTVSQASGDLLGGTSSESHTYRLTKASGNWLLAGVPWPLYDCTQEK